MALLQTGVIFNSPDIQVKHAPGGTDVCFVTFTSLGRGHIHGFGEKFLGPRGLSAFHFISKWDHWYQPASVLQGIRVVKALIDERGFSHVVTYGASMGGYGAAAYSGPWKRPPRS